MGDTDSDFHSLSTTKSGRFVEVKETYFTDTLTLSESTGKNSG